MKPVTLFIFQSSDGHKCGIAALNYNIAAKQIEKMTVLECKLIASEKLDDLNAASLLYAMLVQQAQTRPVIIDDQILAF
jgi:hypothetical protein